MQYSVFSIQCRKSNRKCDAPAFHTEYGIRYTEYSRHARGVTVILVLAFMGIFALIVGTITSYVFEQGKYGRALFAREQALHISEAGLEYYKWWLGRQPSSVLTTGVGLVSPYTYAVNDPEGGTLGSAVITATPALQCGAVQWIDISSRGTSNASPGFPRTLAARYMKPSVAEYSYLLNTSVLAGADRQIMGPYHSNGGIRMDGTNNSNVTSAVSTWNCTSSYGCNPPQSSAPGVVGSGSGVALWKYPAATIDFTGIATDFPGLKTKAQTSGIMLNPTSVQVGGVQQGSTFSSVGGTDQRGFRLIFNSNGTVSVYRVTGTSYVLGYHLDDFQWHRDYHTITAQTLVGTYNVPSGCSLIYSEAKTWIEGTVAGKVTIVAADAGSFSPDIILNGNIVYAAADGSVGLTAIAEHSVLIPFVAPDTMSIRGIFIAQSGYFGRDFYDCIYSGTPYDRRASLTENGTIVSNLRTATKWSYGYCSGISGFASRTDSYDRLLAFSPPPFTPSASVDYQLSLWREQ